VSSRMVELVADAGLPHARALAHRLPACGRSLCRLRYGRGSIPFAAVMLLPLFASAQPAANSSPDRPGEDIAFFEKRIRPVLVQNCYVCHSQQAQRAGKLKGGLRVDDRHAIRSGGESGPAIVPGDVENSLLISALQYESLRMPPDRKLAEETIRDFERWIRSGAADPREPVGDAGAHAAQPPARSAGMHWAYLPPQPSPSPDLPADDLRRARTDLDSYLLAAQRLREISAADEADGERVRRRLSFDLRGVPPLPDDGDDPHSGLPDQFERTTDLWLATPRFGERWGRHWLDLARFAESLTLRGFVLPEAWRYRDYVFDYWNEDRPYQEFIREQVAGDLLPYPALQQQQRQLIATTFLALGNTNLEEQDKRQLEMDVVDEQLDVIGKTILAQTISCARCHDHKFDPIGTRTYYAMAGILRNCQTLEHENVSKWLELPLPVDADLESRLREQESELASLDAELKSLQASLKALADGKPGARTRIAPAELPGIVVDDAQARRVGEWKLSTHTTPYVGDGYLHDLDAGKGTKTLTFLPELQRAGTYEVRFAYTPGENRAASVSLIVFSADGEKTVQVNQRLTPPIDGQFISLGRYRFEPTGQSFVIVDTTESRGHVVADAVQFLAEGDLPQDKPPSDLDAPNKHLPSSDVRRKELEARLQEAEKQRKSLRQQGPHRPLYMSVREREQAGDCAVHIRGSVHTLGDTVPRGFPDFQGGTVAASIAAKESGRRELAEWLVDRTNPLTWRVLANRLWTGVMGTGLARSTENFGTTGEAPSHPELLDRLALWISHEAATPKLVVRRIVLSSSYRLSTDASPAAMQADPENRLRWRMPRKRLDAESLLNAMLVAADAIDWRYGGSTLPPGLTADYGFEQRSSRRAEYWPVFRNALPDLFEAFDFADPSVPVGRRDESTVATQALTMLNHALVVDLAQQTALQVLPRQPPSRGSSDPDRLDALYRRVLGRPPSDPERRKVLEFLDASVEESPIERWTAVVQSLFASIDFRYLE